MFRIDTSTRAVNLHGTGKDGFTDGNPGTGVAATDLTADWFNAVQEELASFVQAEGITLVKGTHTQLRSAVIALLQSAAHNIRPSQLQWISATDAAARADKVYVNPPEYGTTKRTLVERMLTGGGLTSPANVRRYLASSDGASLNAAHEIVINASWNGTEWAKQDSVLPAFRLSFSDGLRVHVAYTATFLESAWTLLFHVTSSGVVLANGDYRYMQDLTRSTALGREWLSTDSAIPYLRTVVSSSLMNLSGSVRGGFTQRIVLPQDATLRSVSVRIMPNEARATVANRMEIRVVRVNILTSASTDLGTVTDDGTGSEQTRSITGLTEVIDNASWSYGVLVRGGTPMTGVPTNPGDVVYGGTVGWSDPGPRNH